MENRQRNRKRTGLLVALALCCILAVGGGVMAWFSAQDSKTNTFTNESGITEPEMKPDPDTPTEPGKEPVEETDGNIVETEWNDKSPLAPNSIIPKNPNMGIGKKSKPAYVFAMVENNLPDGAYFVLGSGWKPVEGYYAEYAGAKNPAIPQTAKTYKNGLFVYVGEGTDWQMLAPTPDTGEGVKDNYTGELFDKVYTNDTFASSEIPDQKKDTIKVSAYFAAASVDSDYKDEGKTQLTDEVKTEIDANVKVWAKNVKNN